MSTCIWKPDVKIISGSGFLVGCEEQPWDNPNGHGRCIFHAQSDSGGSETDFQLFKKCLLEKIERVEKDEQIDCHRFEGYCFPIAFNYSHLLGLKKPINFSAARFGAGAFFYLGAFAPGTTFEDAHFQDGSKFEDVIFKGDVSFQNTTFGNHASFEDMTFQGVTRILFKSFGNWVKFKNIHFESIVDFGHKIFGDGLMFQNIQFDKGASFILCRFEGAAKFEDITSGDNIYFSFSKFDKPHEVTFRKIDMSKVYFLKSNLGEVNFIEVNWPKKSGGRACVADEFEIGELVPLVLHNRDFRVAFADVRETYRQLIVSHESNRYFRLADEFNSAWFEMEERESPFYSRFIHVLYRLISGYGTNYLRAFSWLMGILFLSTFFYIASGFNIRIDSERSYTVRGAFHREWNKRMDIMRDFGYALDHSLSVATFQRSDRVTPPVDSKETNFLFKLTVYTEAIAVPAFLALFLFALKRRFRR